MEEVSGQEAAIAPFWGEMKPFDSSNGSCDEQRNVTKERHIQERSDRYICLSESVKSIKPICAEDAGDRNPI